MSTLLPILLGTTATRAPEHPVVRKPVVDTVEISIVERGTTGDPLRTTLVLPGHGRLEAAVATSGAGRVCEVETMHDVDRTTLSVKLECRTPREPDDDLRIEARPHVRAGATVVLGKVVRADGRTVEVTASLR